MIRIIKVKKMSYTEAALRGCGTLDTLLNLGKVGLQIAKDPSVREGAMAFLSGFKGGRGFPQTSEERDLMIQILKNKYRKTLKKYAKFRAEYPYTVSKSLEILARRKKMEEARKRREEAGIVEDDSDIIYPSPPRRRRRSTLTLSDLPAPPPRSRRAPKRYS